MTGTEVELDAKRLNRWLTLGANLAVLAGIILLIVELAQNRETTRAQIRAELSAGIVDLLQTPAENEQLADVLFRALAGEPLTPRELFQFQLRTNALLRYWENVHYQYREGLYDDVEFGRQKEAWRASLRSAPLAREYWCRVRGLYSPSFAAELDGLLDEACEEDVFAMIPAKIEDIARRYTAAWNSGRPENVAAFFSLDGTLFVNGEPSSGREAITALAGSFMSGFPDMELVNDRIEILPGAVRYHWTFSGSNTGPGGTGNPVRFSGYEEWSFAPDGLIARSRGQFDEAEYQRQLEGNQGGG